MKTLVKVCSFVVSISLMSRCSTTNDLAVQPSESDAYVREAKVYYESASSKSPILDQQDGAGLSSQVLDNFRKNIAWSQAILSDDFIDVPIGSSTTDRIQYNFEIGNSSTETKSAKASETHLLMYKRENTWRAFYIKIISQEKLVESKRTILNYREYNTSFSGAEIRYNLTGKCCPA